MAKCIVAEGFKPSGAAYTRLTVMGRAAEVMAMSKKPLAPPCRRISADEYVDTRTGEVLPYSHQVSRADNINGVRRTLSRIRSLINCNVVDPTTCRWVTLTYAQPNGKPMTDRERLHDDFRRFWQKFKRWCKAQGHTTPEYISVVEPQGSGSWHVHAFFLWDGKAPYVPNKALRKLWGQGFVTIKQPVGVDNMGAYFSAYLADIPLEDLPKAERSKVQGLEVVTKDFEDARGHRKSKAFVKGGRLVFYPPKFNILRSSRGVKQPEVEWTDYQGAKEKVSGATETFSRAYSILDDEGKPLNTIYKAYYSSFVIQKQAPHDGMALTYDTRCPHTECGVSSCPLPGVRGKNAAAVAVTLCCD